MEKGIEWIAVSKPASIGVLHRFDDNTYRVVRLIENSLEKWEEIEKKDSEFDALEIFYTEAGNMKEKLELASRIKNYLVAEKINDKVPHEDLYDFVKEVWMILNTTGLTNKDFICQWAAANGVDTGLLNFENEMKFEKEKKENENN